MGPADSKVMPFVASELEKLMSSVNTFRLLVGTDKVPTLMSDALPVKDAVPETPKVVVLTVAPVIVWLAVRDFTPVIVCPSVPIVMLLIGPPSCIEPAVLKMVVFSPEVILTAPTAFTVRPATALIVPSAPKVKKSTSSICLALLSV